MTVVRWGSLITTSDGEIDRDRFRTAAAVFLALAGGVALIVGVLYQTFRNGQAEISGLLWMAGATVAPLTGGTIGAAFGAASGKAATKQVMAGQAVGRRSADSNTEPIPEAKP